MNESSPVISIIAVSYNHSDYILETLNSIGCQTFQDFEVIFCDDCSRDQSVALATEWFSRNQIASKLIIHRENKGLCKTLNEAMSLCRGKYIQAIACDDRLHPDKLEKQLAIFEKSPSSVAVVCSDASLIDREGRPCKPFSFFKRYAVPDNTSRENLFKQILEGNCIPAMAALTRREALLDVGPYDESLEFEDYDMWLRILRKYDFVVTSDVTADYRIHGSNLHLSPALCQKYRRVKYQVVRKHLDHPLGREQLRRDLVNMISENSLCPIEVEDLVSMEFNLQEVADLFPYWYRWVRKQGHSVRKRTPLSFLRRAKRLVRQISH